VVLQLLLQLNILSLLVEAVVDHTEPVVVQADI
jgi:hypothetical protein